MSLTFLNPDVIKDSSIGGSKLKENSISISNIDVTKSYVDELVGDINSVLESIITGWRL